MTFDIDCLDPAFAPGTGTPVSLEGCRPAKRCRCCAVSGHSILSAAMSSKWLLPMITPTSPRLRALEAIVALRGAAAIDTDARAGRIALIGLRGAGKSTLGRKIAEAFGLRFVELNREIESNNGLGISEIFALYGGERYRQLERDCLDRMIASDGPMVLAIAGGIVDQPETYRRLLSNFTVIWLRASPDEHMARVLAQGDRRPVAGHPAAMEHLHGMLRDREPAYALAHTHFDTSGQSLSQSVDGLCELIEAMLPATKALRKSSVTTRPNSWACPQCSG